MSNYRYTVWSDRNLRLQEVVPERRVRLPYPTGPQYPYKVKCPEIEEDTVVALTWPEKAGWRHH